MGLSRRHLALLATLGLLTVGHDGTHVPRPVDTVSIPISEATALCADTVRAARTLAELHTSLVGEELAHLAVTIAVEARRSELPVELLLAVIRVESSGNAYAVSDVGAMGLMQLMPATAEAIAAETGIRWMGEPSLFEPTTNVRLGARYLRKLVDRYGSVSTALAAYNWGPTRIASRIRRGEAIPVIYAERVLGEYGGA